MGFFSNGCQIDIISEFHTLSVNAKDFHTADLIRYTNIDLAIKATEASERRIETVRPVSGADADDLTATFDTVHESQELSDDTLLDLALRLLTVGRNRIDLIDEDNGGLVCLRLSEGLPQILLGLTSHLRHDLRTIQQEEECTSLVGDGSGNQGFTGTGWAKQQHALRRLDTEGSEQLGMPERELNHLTNLGHLLTAATNVIVADAIEFFFVFALDWFTLVKDHRVGADDAKFSWISFDNLELNRLHTLSYEESVALLDRSVAIFKVGDEVSLCQVAGNTFDAVFERKDVNASTVRHIRACVHLDNVTQAHTEVVAYDFVDADFVVGHCIALLDSHRNADRLVTLLTLQ